ncbi:MAG TPA: hypothetical protein VLJ57_21810 [Burkholderiaceae bacterium]|nr:hypothetical protein [Burkholderiaceae bacterium]
MKASTKKTTSGGNIQIIVGSGWQRFAFTTRGLDFLGTIRRGMEIGALARDEAGGYLQVNGDIHQVLNKSRVAAHLRKAGFRSDPIAVTIPPTETERAAVSVVIKRRRRVLMPQV